MSSKKKDVRLPYDKDGRSIQVAATMQEHDASDSINISPKTISAILNLKVPDLALVLVVKSDKAFRYGSNASLDAAAAGKGFKLAVADKDVRIPCATADTISVLADAFPAVFDFFFEVI